MGGSARPASAAAKPQFVRHRVDQLYSVAHLFGQKARCGVYVLVFTNGERYVGQSTDVAKRFAQHQRTWDDIEFLEFCRCPRARLDTLEQQMINHHRGKGRLRNITHALGPIGESDLDPTVTPVEQSAWLNDDVPDPADVTMRADDPEQRLKHRHKYEKLRRRSVFPWVVGIVNHYVQTTVPKPRETERTFWSLSCLPSTGGGRRLATLSISKMETLWLWTAEVPDVGEVFGGCINVSRAALVKAAGPVSRLRREFPELTFGNTSYESAGGDGLNITFYSPAGYAQIMELPGFVPAARAMNLMLMRKGATFHWQWHCYDLADWGVRGPIPEEEFARLLAEYPS